MRTLLLFVALLTVLLAAAQPPNDECSAATVLPVNQLGQCPGAGWAGNTVDATQSGIPACSSTTTGFKDIWYAFNSGANVEILVDVTFFTIDEWGIEVLDGCGGNTLFCDSATNAQYVVPVSTATDYLIRFFTNTDIGSGGLFTICLSGDGTVPVCDGGDVTTDQGFPSVTICADGIPDVIGFGSTSTSAEQYTFILTHLGGRIIGEVTGVIDFDTMAVDLYTVYGISHNGALVGVAPMEDILNVTSTGQCLEVSTTGADVDVQLCMGLPEHDQDQWGIPRVQEDRIWLVAPSDIGAATVGVWDASGRVVAQERLAFSAGSPVAIATGGQHGVFRVLVQWPEGRKVFSVVL
ncbi:MAG: hypothetical protein IPJ76_07155 [Flavobacteriales bacterium]|nr:MAG: hypothetical protein IPJ76_07155 [Flavobacteriales bacterium]